MGYGIALKDFGGLAPRYPAVKLPANFAQIVRNVDLSTGTIRAIRRTGDYVFEPENADTASMYLYKGVSPEVWFTRQADTNWVKSPVAGDAFGRVYFTEDGDQPQVTSAVDAIDGGAVEYPKKSYNLGIPVPANTPTVSVNLGKQNQSLTDIVDDSAPIQITKSSHGLTTGQRVYIENISLRTPSQMPRSTPVTAVTYVGHGLTNDMEVTFSGFTAGTDWYTPFEGITFTVTRTSDDVFTIPIATDGYSAGWDGNGIWNNKDKTSFRSILNGKVFTVTYVDGNNLTLDGTNGDGKTWLATEGGRYDLIALTEDKVSTSYVYTYVTAWGEEGPPSLPSDTIDVSFEEGDSVTITNTSTGPGAGYYTAGMVKRLYRASSSGGYNPAYLLVEDNIAVAAQPSSDTATDDDLSSPLASTNYDEPPSDMFGLVAMPNGIVVGFSGNQVCFCEPYLPHAWPTSYRLSLDFDIVGGVVFGNSVLVVTEGNPYVITGINSAQMSSVKMELNQACVSKRSIADIGTAGIYASPDGLVLVTSNSAVLITEPLIKPSDWKKPSADGGYEPSSIDGYYYEGKYMGFYGSGDYQAGFIYTPESPGNKASFVSIDTFALAGFNDLENDQLYLHIVDKIYPWEGCIGYSYGSTSYDDTASQYEVIAGLDTVDIVEGRKAYVRITITTMAGYLWVQQYTDPYSVTTIQTLTETGTYYLPFEAVANYEGIACSARSAGAYDFTYEVFLCTTDNLLYAYRSKKFLNPSPLNLGAAKVLAPDGPTSLNMVINPDFEEKWLYWTKGSANSLDASIKYTGSRSAKLLSNGSANVSGPTSDAIYIPDIDYIYRFSYYIRSDQTVGTTYIRALYYSDLYGEDYISDEDWQVADTSGVFVRGTRTISSSGATLTLPATCQSIRIMMLHFNGSGNPNIASYLDGVQLEIIATATTEASTFSNPGGRPLYYRLYADDVLKHFEQIISGDPFRLPAGYMADEIEIEFTGYTEIVNSFSAETMVDLRKI